MRVAFTLIGGENWIGGRNYLVNLLRVLGTHESQRIAPLLFVDDELPSGELAAFASVPGVELIRSPAMRARRKARALLAAVLRGYDAEIRAEFLTHRADVVFEAAQFFGWRPGVPVIAWMPDFQHRAMPAMFSRAGLLKRELGFRAQVHSGRTIMLSSEHARLACEHYYPSTIGRTYTVRFAVPADDSIGESRARRIADQYGLPEKFFYMPNQFWQHKNHLLVLEALALLKSRGMEIVVAASGRQADPRNPRHFNEVLAVARDRGMESCFRPLGMIPQEHVTALMLSGTALLNPSRYEGWSTTVEEARSLGTPLLLSDIPVHREQAGEAASYFDPHSANGLAIALGNFSAVGADDRRAARVEAQKAAAVRVAAFAAEVVEVAQRCLAG